MEICSIFWVRDITDWWRQQEESHSNYADLANVAYDTFSVIQHDVRVETGISRGRDVIGWRQAKTMDETLSKQVNVWEYAGTNNWILVGNDRALDMTQREKDLDMLIQVEERTFQRIAKVHNFREIWQRSHNLLATQMESCTQNKQKMVVGYISDSKGIVKSS